MLSFAQLIRTSGWMGMTLCLFAAPLAAQVDTAETTSDSAQVFSLPLDPSQEIVLYTDTAGYVLSPEDSIALADSLAAAKRAQEDSLLRLELGRLTQALAQRTREADSLRLLARWLRLDQQVDRTFYTFMDTARRERFLACVVDPKQVAISIHNRYGKRGRKVHDFESVEELAREEGDSLLFAMNAGMYQRNRHAQGLFITEGKTQNPIDTATRGYGNFYLQPNGVFALDSNQHAYVVTTQAYAALADSVGITYATQSGPMMIVDDVINPIFGINSPNHHIRNGVGVTPYGQVVFAISTQPVTFYELSTFMQRQGCVQALYLDGAISEAYFPTLTAGSPKNKRALGPIVVVRPVE